MAIDKIKTRILDENEVRIRVKSTCRDMTSGETGNVEYEVPGLFREAVIGINGDGSERIGLQLLYKEPMETGLPETDTELTFTADGLARLSHDGGIKCSWLLDTRNVHCCSYETPFFSDRMVVNAEVVEFSLTSEGGSARLEYYLHVEGDRHYTWTRLDYYVFPVFSPAMREKLKQAGKERKRHEDQDPVG